jgi:hypothetical protein
MMVVLNSLSSGVVPHEGSYLLFHFSTSATDLPAIVNMNAFCSVIINEWIFLLEGRCYEATYVDDTSLTEVGSIRLMRYPHRGDAGDEYL